MSEGCSQPQGDHSATPGMNIIFFAAKGGSRFQAEIIFAVEKVSYTSMCEQQVRCQVRDCHVHAGSLCNKDVFSPVAVMTIVPLKGKIEFLIGIVQYSHQLIEVGTKGMCKCLSVIAVINQGIIGCICIRLSIVELC